MSIKSLELNAASRVGSGMNSAAPFVRVSGSMFPVFASTRLCRPEDSAAKAASGGGRVQSFSLGKEARAACLLETIAICRNLSEYFGGRGVANERFTMQN